MFDRKAIMKLTKRGRYLTTVPVIAWWISDRIEACRRKKRVRIEAVTIDNLERPHQLKERGIISEEDFPELKEKLKKQI